MRMLGFLILIAPAALGQTIYFNCVGGQYGMEDLKSIQTEHLNEYIQATKVPVVQQLSFPISLQAELGGNYYLNQKRAIGVFVNYAITRGQLGYSDFSGEVISKKNVSRYSIGAKYTAMISNYFGFYGKVSYVYSKLNLFDHVVASGNTFASSDQNFHSSGFSVEPGLLFSYALGSKISVQVTSGYEFSSQGKIYYDPNTQYYLLKGNGQEARIDWSGFRAGLGVSYKVK